MVSTAGWSVRSLAVDAPGNLWVLEGKRLHVLHGDSWIDASNARKKAPYRPAWPEQLDERWRGLDAGL